MNVHVITHAGCVDGFTSAYLLWKVFPEATFHAGVHDTPPPTGLSGHVIIADFSYSAEELRELAAAVERVTVLDHHAGPYEELSELGDLIEYVFDSNRCGASLVWQWLHPETAIPTLVQYVEDRDLWRNLLPHTAEISAHMQATPFTFEAWDEAWELFNDDFNAVVQSGKGCLRMARKTVVSQAALAVPVCIDGVWTLAAPCPYSIGTEVAGLLAEQNPDLPFTCYFIDGPNGRKYGLRTRRDDFDVSAIAKRFGGSGHKQAAGFSLPSSALDQVHSRQPGAFVVQLWSEPDAV